MSEHWEEPKEEDGLTLGPEETLQREIEKSKNLKVDLLRLRDKIEKLKSEKTDLAQKNQLLKERLAKLDASPESLDPTNSIFQNALVFALVFGFMGILWFLTRN